MKYLSFSFSFSFSLLLALLVFTGCESLTGPELGSIDPAYAKAQEVTVQIRDYDVLYGGVFGEGPDTGFNEYFSHLDFEATYQLTNRREVLNINVNEDNQRAKITLVARGNVSLVLTGQGIIYGTDGWYIDLSQLDITFNREQRWMSCFWNIEAENEDGSTEPVRLRWFGAEDRGTYAEECPVL